MYKRQPPILKNSIGRLRESVQHHKSDIVAGLVVIGSDIPQTRDQVFHPLSALLFLLSGIFNLGRGTASGTRKLYTANHHVFSVKQLQPLEAQIAHLNGCLLYTSRCV